MKERKKNDYWKQQEEIKWEKHKVITNLVQAIYKLLLLKKKLYVKNAKKYRKGKIIYKKRSQSSFFFNVFVNRTQFFLSPFRSR